jgi:DNA repair protein RecO
MKQIVTKGIIVARTNYGEADRIITVLTPDQGKLRLMAKGVRRPKSKLAGGIELFSVSDITFIRGKSEIGTLISSRLDMHFGNIVKDIDRTMLGYELIKQLNKVTEDEPEEAYFNLLEKTFESLNNEHINSELIQLWFTTQLLKLAGHTLNLKSDADGNTLQADQAYNFSFDDMAFVQGGSGRYSVPEIKVLRLLFSDNSPLALQQVQGIENVLKQVQQLINTVQKSFIVL